VHFCETEIVFAVDGDIAGRLLNSNCHPEGLAAFKRTNYELQGSVGYQSFLQGTLAGLVLAFGPYGERRDPEDSTAKELQTIEPSEVGSVEGVLLDPVPLAGEEIIVPGHTVHDGVIAGTGEKTVEVPGTVTTPADPPVPVPAAVDEPIANIPTESTTSTKDGSEAAA